MTTDKVKLKTLKFEPTDARSIAMALTALDATDTKEDAFTLLFTAALHLSHDAQIPIEIISTVLEDVHTHTGENYKEIVEIIEAMRNGKMRLDKAKGETRH